MSNADLSKYNVHIKLRSKVSAAATSERVATGTVLVHGRDGKTLEIASVPSSKVKEAAARVIDKHHDVIRRLAKR